MYGGSALKKLVLVGMFAACMVFADPTTQTAQARHCRSCCRGVRVHRHVGYRGGFGLRGGRYGCNGCGYGYGYGPGLGGGYIGSPGYYGGGYHGGGIYGNYGGGAAYGPGYGYGY